MVKSLLQRLSLLQNTPLSCAVKGLKKHLVPSQIESLGGEGGLGGGEPFSALLSASVRLEDSPNGCASGTLRAGKGSPPPSKQTPPRTPKQIIGQQGEDAAAHLAQRLGMKILARNWRKGRLELDIIALDGDTIVFIEVKTRKAGGMQAPYEALTLQKQRTLIRAAQAWLAANDAWHFPYRFDLISVLHNGSTFTPEHIPHVFDLTSALGSSHATWQPW